MAASKRKGAEKSKSTTPAKKAKVEAKAPASAKKATPARGKAATPKVTSTKAVKKSEPPAKGKKTPAKVTKTPPAKAKTPTSTRAASRTPVKTTKTPAKEVKKPQPKKPEPAKAKPVVKAKPVINVTRAKLEKAKALKARAATAKAKLKSAKALPKGKVVEAKKTEEKEVKETPKAKAAPTKPAADKKRKAEEPTEDTDAKRKRRTITPNKKFADFELDVPAKRTITPNKKYADYETDVPAKAPGRVSELRAFIQEKKTSPEKSPKADKKTKSAAASPASPAKTKGGAGKDTASSSSEESIKVFKQSEMKPAEKLLKKLQKKLEKEAKEGTSPASPTDSREKAKIKITKVVDYNKPLSSDDVEMKKLAKKAAQMKKSPMKPKPAAIAPIKAQVAKPEKAKATPAKPSAKVKGTPKATPKQPEKVVKPKKIKEFKREERPIQAKFLSQRNIRLDQDNQKVQCWITGIDVFPSGEIIMVDMSNRKIKLFSKDFEFLSQIQLDTIPQDISVSPVNACCAYFTKPFSKEGIQKVNMADGKLTLKEFFVTNGTNRGITCTKSGILTSVQDGRYHDVDINHFKIYLLDYTGNILQSVSTDTNGSRLFKLPLYFTVNSTGKQMIVADCIKQTSYVVNVDMSGKIKFKYEGMNNNAITPRGLAIDDDDNIFVTEWERNNVYILSPAGKRLQLLFSHHELLQDKIDGLLKPYQLCLYKVGDEKRMIISQESCNTVKVFKVMTKEQMDVERAEIAKAAAEKKAKEAAVENGDDAKAKGDAAANGKASVQAKLVTIVKQKSAAEKSEEQSEEVPAPAVPVVEPIIEKTEVTPLGPEASDVAVESSEAVPPAVEDLESSTPEIGEDTTESNKQVVDEAQEPPQLVSQESKKAEIFAETAGDFSDNEEAENVESDINGKLQDIVDAFPGEESVVEQAAVNSAGDVMEQTSVTSTSVMVEQQVPEVVQAEAMEVEESGEIALEAVSQQVIVQADIIADQTVSVPQNIVEVQPEILNTNIVETVVDNSTVQVPVADAGVNNIYETIMYDIAQGDAPVDGINIVTTQVVPATTETEQAVPQQETVLDHNIQYQADVPMELETITTEYVV